MKWSSWASECLPEYPNVSPAHEWYNRGETTAGKDTKPVGFLGRVHIASPLKWSVTDRLSWVFGQQLVRHKYDPQVRDG